MLKICEDYASHYNISFSAKLMHFGRNKIYIKNTISMANRCTMDYMEQCVHLGTIIHSDITHKHIDSAVNDLFMRTNNLIADFFYTHDSSTLSDSIFTLSPDLSRFKSTNNKSQLYHTDIHVQVLIAFND